jgi:hypothetical protein
LDVDKLQNICILIPGQRKLDFPNIFAATAGKAEGKEISLRSHSLELND